MRSFTRIVIFMFLVFVQALGARAQYITTYAGTGFVTGYSGDGGPATDARLNSPSDIVVDAAGNLIIADFINNVIRKVDTFGTITTVAGTGFGSGTAGGGAFSGDGGPATIARLNGPFGLAMDAAGDIIFADGYNHVVRKVTPAGIISTIAGIHTTAGYFGDGGMATDAELNNPVGVAVDKAGNIYVADDHNNVIRKINTSGTISTVVGNHIAGRSGDGGPATAAELNLPIGIALDTFGNLYIADTHNNVIRRVNTAGIISTYAGGDTAGYTGDGGLAVNARLDSPQRISFDDSNNLYISDYYNNVVRMVNHNTGIITTIAGNGYGAGSNGTMGGYSGDDSLAINAMLYLPHGVAFDHQHHIFICDRANDVIRKIGPPPPADHTLVKTTGENENSALSAYPNPVIDGTLQLSLHSSVNEPITYTFSTLPGQLLISGAGKTNSPIQVNMQLPAGMYFLTAVSARGRWMTKVVVK